MGEPGPSGVDLTFVPAGELVKELDERFDVMFFTGFMADPPPEDEAVSYWMSQPQLAQILTQYTFSHHAVSNMRQHLRNAMEDNEGVR